MRNFVAALVMRYVDRLSQPARASARAVGEITRAQRMAQDAGAQWSRGLDQLDGRLDRLSKASLVTDGLDRAGQAMMRPLRTATTNAAAFEAGMTGIGITAQLTDRQLQPMRRTILETAAELGALPDTVQGAFASVLAEGVYRTEAELSRAGVAVAKFQQLAARMRDPISGAEAGGLSAGLATSFNIAADRLDRANAMLNRASQRGGVGMGVQARNLPGQAAAMKGLGGNTERGLADLLAANQMAKRAAGSSDEGANNINNLLAAVTSPETLKNFREAGVNLEREISRGIERGISPLETVATVTARLTRGNQFRMGELFGDRQARLGVMALVQNFDEFRSISQALTADDTLSAYYADLERAALGPAASFDRYTSSMARAGIATGTILAPAVGLAADLLGRLANWMSRASESGNPLARAAVYIVGGFAGLAVAAGAVGHAVVGVLGPLFIMRTMFGSLGGAALKGAFSTIVGGLGRARLAMVAFNLAALANPLGLVIAGVALAVIGVALLVRKYWQPIKAFMTGLGQVLGEALAPLGEALRPLAPLWAVVTRGVADFFGWIGRLLQPVQSTSTELENATSAGRRFGQGLVLAFRIITAPAQLAAAVVRLGMAGVRAALSWSPMGVLRSAWGGVSAYFTSWAARFAGFGRMIMRGLIQGLTSMRSPVAAAVATVGGAAADSFRRRLGIRSPSRVFAGLGVDTMAGLALGLGRGSRAPLARVAAVSAALISAMPAAASAGVGLPVGGGGAAGTAGRAAGVVIEKVEQHFHLPAGLTDPRELARELKRLEAQGLRRALTDVEGR